MADALEAGYNLGGLALCFMALAALLAVKGVVSALLGAIDFAVAGIRPLHGLVTGAENAVIGALDSAIKGVEKETAKFESGLIDAFGMLIAIPALLALGTRNAFVYLWDSALKPTIRTITNPIKATAEKALGTATAVENELDTARRALEARIVSAERAALSGAEAFAVDKIGDAAAELRHGIAAALEAAERYADEAVSRLRAAEGEAIAGAIGLAVEAKQAGLAAAAAAEQAAERAAGSAIAQSEAASARAIAEAQAAGQAALGTVRGIAVGAADELGQIEGNLGALGVAGLIASIPAIGTLVNAIATEAGLENAECRSKVKGICGTDPSAWGELLGGLAALGIAFNLRELVQLAEPVIEELAPVIAKVAG